MSSPLARPSAKEALAAQWMAEPYFHLLTENAATFWNGTYAVPPLVPGRACALPAAQHGISASEAAAALDSLDVLSRERIAVTEEDVWESLPPVMMPLVGQQTRGAVGRGSVVDKAGFLVPRNVWAAVCLAWGALLLLVSAGLFQERLAGAVVVEVEGV